MTLKPSIHVLLIGSILVAGGGYAAPSDHLVSKFSFDNPAQVADDTGSFDNDGTPVGDATHTSLALEGGGALLLDGDGDLIELPGTGADYTTQLTTDGEGFTLTCWAYISPSPSSEQFRFFSTYMPGSFVQAGWGVGHASADRLRATTYGIKDYDAGAGTAPLPGAWHHYAYVYRNDPIDRIDYYIDGIQVDSLSSGSTGLHPATTAGFAIGALGLPTSPQFFDGRLDDLRIYDIELTASEIGDIFAEAGGSVYDVWAISFGLDPAGNGAPGEDPDDDGSINQQEFDRGTDPSDEDTDGDQLKDGVETDTGVYDSPADTGTDPLDPDSDGDTFPDGEEVNLLLSDPNDPEDPDDSDLDDDGLPNAWEILHGLDPNDDGSINPDHGAWGDPDQDGLPNDEEFFMESDPQVNESGKAWLPRPAKARLMVINAHPDDEGIFFGGVIPYYTQVRQLPTVAVSMTSGDWGRIPEIREAEFRDATWAYGLRNQPIFPRFRDYPTSTLDGTWDVWADGVLDGDDVADGRARAGAALAYWIRRYRPDVVATHDLNGEYGHNNHKATALATTDAVLLAADPAVSLDGLPAWQVKKLYIHRDATHPLFHDHWQDVSIDSDGDGTPDQTPIDTANVGLDFHVSQGRPNVSTCYASGETSSGWEPHPGEWWGLYSSTVGPDTVAPDFLAPDADNNTVTYTGWALGDFFEHLTTFPDSDYDELPDPWELAHFPSLADADPAADSDGDGRATGDEFVAGTDPHVMDGIKLELGGVAETVDFTVPAAAGAGYEGLTRRYRLLFSPDLADWGTVVAEGVADGTPLSYPIPAHSAWGFYGLDMSIE